MKILITGASGLVGSYLTNNLPGYDVTAINHHDLDLLDREMVQAFFADKHFHTIIHCATYGRRAVRTLNPAIFQNNLFMFNNLASCKQHYQQFINLASGAEFDVEVNNDQTTEEELFQRYPSQLHGASKNIIARLVTQLPNFYNLRMFGSFGQHDTEYVAPLQDVVKNISANRRFRFENDRFLDLFSLHDLAVVIDQTIQGNLKYNDVNLVYDQKHRLSDVLRIYYEQHGVDPGLVKFLSTSDQCFTGNGAKLASHNFDLWGLERSLKEYI
jgi:GDP-L-fucose synthase